MLETLVRHLDMVRLTVAATAILMMMGCSGLIDNGGNGGISPAEAKARQLWLTKALPVLNANCATCHAGSREVIDFISGDADLAKRDRILTYDPPVLNLADAPQSSRLLTKGSHEGPELDAVSASDLLEWVQAERDAALSNPEDNPPSIETAQFTPQICTSGLPDDPPTAPNPNCPFNIVPLDSIGAPGASIKFVVQALGSGLYVTNLRLVPGTDGAFIEHPLFVAYPADGTDPKADTIDRFFNVKMNLMVGATLAEQSIGGGTAAFVGFLSTDKLAIHFKSVNIFQLEDGPPAVLGCKDLAGFKAVRTSFTANVGAGVQPGAQNCAQCHRGQDANATSAIDMTLMNDADDAKVLLACNEIRTRLNLPDIPSSGVFIAVDPANMNHPRKFSVGDLATFKSNLNAWIISERDSP